MDSAPLPPSWMPSWGFAPAAASSGRPRHGRAWRRSRIAGLVPEKNRPGRTLSRVLPGLPSLTLHLRSLAVLPRFTHGLPLARANLPVLRCPSSLLPAPPVRHSLLPRHHPPAPAPNCQPRPPAARLFRLLLLPRLVPPAPARCLLRLLLLVSCSSSRSRRPLRSPSPSSPYSPPAPSSSCSPRRPPSPLPGHPPPLTS